MVCFVVVCGVLWCLVPPISQSLKSYILKEASMAYQLFDSYEFSERENTFTLLALNNYMEGSGSATIK